MKDEMIDAIYEFGVQMTRAAPGSDERVRGVVLCGLLREYRQMRDRLAEIDPGWTPEVTRGVPRAER